MITNPAATAASLATALAHLARDVHAAPAPAPGPLLRAARQPALPPGGAPRTLATARRSLPPVRRRRTGRSSAAGYASSSAAARASSGVRSSASSKTASSKSDPLAFLRDPKLSIEEKLMKLLGHMNAKWEKEMQQKLDEIAGGQPKQAASGSSGSSKKKKGGLLGSLGPLGDLVQSVVAPATAALKVPLVRDLLKQVGGPVLAAGATALGFPQLAPVLLRYGPELVNAASSLASSLDGALASSGSSGSSSGTSSSGGSKAKSDAETQTLLLEIQRIQQKQQEMFGLVSNVLKSNHDTRLAVVNNIR